MKRRDTAGSSRLQELDRLKMMTGASESKDTYVSTFSAFEKQLSDDGWSWTLPMREAAIRRFAEAGFPTTRLEDWKYTNVAPLTRTQFQLAPSGENGLSAGRLLASPLAGMAFGEEACRLVFVNGRYAGGLSSGAIVRKAHVGSLREAAETRRPAIEPHLGRYVDYAGNAFVALNTGFMLDGAFIEVPQGVVMDRPIYVLHVSTATERPAACYPRNMVLAGPDSQLSVVEAYIGLTGGSYLTNSVTEIVLGPNSVLEYYRLQGEGAAAFHVSSVNVAQSRDSSLRSHSVSLGGALIRNDIRVALEGPGSDCSLNGLYVVRGREHVDNHTVIDHVSPHCTSREMYKGILDGKATAVFNGSIIVRKDAQKTDAVQSNKNLILSEDAVINSKPQLEINADDVKCSHGTTIGQIDRQALFYLRSRGISPRDGQELLTFAFANEILSRMKVESVRSRVERILSEGLNGKEDV